ncbi:protein FAM169B isoform X2 [Pseudoliparis swirei]|uniref:protein FAM169B isoform X2 n=1 Tax=Pseudoliparis swirei TaxID=2059687 RepID=UPI0024BECB75|nr:protein FAM169B isoform X2 [Pseudoliparis swirei]
MGISADMDRRRSHRCIPMWSSSSPPARPFKKKVFLSPLVQIHPINSACCGAAMFPVDLPAAEDSVLTSSSEEYLSSLEAGPRDAEWFQVSQSSKVAITLAHVRRLQLFEDERPDCTLLALHPPDDPTRAAALYLHGKWWPVDDVLRTSSNSRIGLILVRSLMERVIVFLLSRVAERCSREEPLFSLHPRTESCKLLWRDGQAVGFYTFKRKGSLCDGWSGRCYPLPALDTVLVRRSWRRRGLGLQMLEDFCASFPAERFLGVSSPLSPGMAAVCRSFLQQHQEHLEQLYEVAAPGDWTQRWNIWLSIQLGRYSLAIQEESGPTSGEPQRNHDESSHTALQLVSPSRGDPASLTACDVSSYPATGHPSRAGSSPSSETSAAHADDPDPGSPARPPPPNAKQSLRSDSSPCAEPRREKPEAEGAQSAAKRVRRT